MVNIGILFHSFIEVLNDPLLIFEQVLDEGHLISVEGVSESSSLDSWTTLHSGDFPNCSVLTVVQCIVVCHLDKT